MNWHELPHLVTGSGIMVRKYPKRCGYASPVDRKQLLTTFRERLGSVIAGSGLNRSQFAEITELDRSTLSQLLSTANRRLPRLETLATIASTQQVSIDWLVGLSNAGPMQAEMLQEQMSFERSSLAHNDELLIEWLSEAIGYKIRYIPSTLPDLLKTEDVIHFENVDFATSTPEQKIETSAARLAWTRGPGDRSGVLQLGAIGRGLRPRRRHLAIARPGAATRTTRSHDRAHRRAVPDLALVPLRRSPALRRADHDLSVRYEPPSTSARCISCSRRTPMCAR